MWSCESTKALGLDGYNFNFIKKCWNLIGTNFIACMYEFFRIGNLLRWANMTWVTLISKLDEAKEIKEYRPISIIGYLCKVAAKVLADRLLTMMDRLARETQITVFQGRQILHGL